MPANETLYLESPCRTFSGADPGLSEQFNRASAARSHNLSDHPLLALPRLLDLARKMPAADLFYDAGDIQIAQRWDQIPPCGLPVEQLLERIEHAGDGIILGDIHKYKECNK